MYTSIHPFHELTECSAMKYLDLKPILSDFIIGAENHNSNAQRKKYHMNNNEIVFLNLLFGKLEAKSPRKQNEHMTSAP